MITHAKLVRYSTVLSACALVLVAMSFARLEAQNYQRQGDLAEKIASVQQWSRSHDQLDNERYKVIELLQQTALDNKQRLARAEQVELNLEARVNDLIWWVRSVFVALVMQLVGAIIKLIEIRRGKAISIGL